MIQYLPKFVPIEVIGKGIIMLLMLFILLILFGMPPIIIVDAVPLLIEEGGIKSVEDVCDTFEGPKLP